MKRDGAKNKILIVEDDKDVRELVSLYLKREGFAIEEAADGVVALECIESFKPDLVLLDVLLPRLDGIEMLKRLRQTDFGANVPVVLMSAILPRKDLKAETEKLHVISFIQKPFQMKVLLSHVSNALNPGERRSFPELKSLEKESRQKPSILKAVRKPFVPSGKLEEFSIPELLHSIFMEKKTGQLQICSESSVKRIFFQDGLPVYAESSNLEETLGAHLIRRGYINQEQHNEVIKEMTRTGRYFGEILLKLGLIGPHELYTEIEAHLAEKVISLFGWFYGTYNFEDGDSWKDDIIVAKMKPGRLSTEGIQRYWTPDNIQEKIKITDSSQTFVVENAPYTEQQLGLTTHEMRVLQMVRQKCSVGEIVRRIGNFKVVLSNLCTLFLMEQIGFVNRQTLTPPGPSATTNEELEEAIQAEKDERLKVLLTEYLKLRAGDHFKLLGISRDATVSDITKAFKEKRRRYHPDTMAGVDSSIVHEKIEEMYLRIHTAYRTLIDPELRRRYISQLDEAPDGAPTNQEVRAPKHPTVKLKQPDILAFEEGFVLLRSGEYNRASELFKKADEIESKPRYKAYKAWASYLADPENRAEETGKRLASLHKENTREAIIPYLIGSLALRQKDSKKAIVYFEKAIEIDPNHIDSARQLRILRMRQREVSGVFDLFKKKADS